MKLQRTPEQIARRKTELREYRRAWQANKRKQQRENSGVTVRTRVRGANKVDINIKCPHCHIILSRAPNHHCLSPLKIFVEPSYQL